MTELLKLPEGYFFRIILGDKRAYIELRKKTWAGMSSEKKNSVYTEEVLSDEVVQRCQQQALRTFYANNAFELAAEKYLGDTEEIIKEINDA